MLSARCIICERSTTWTVALRGPLREVGVRVHETRSLDACWEELALHPASVVGLEATAANLESLVPWMVRVASTFARVRVVVLASRGMETCQWLWREAGAVHVAFSPREARLLVRLVRRHLSAQPGADTSDQEHIWWRLPWDEARSDTR